jgi:hypothetical protein
MKPFDEQRGYYRQREQQEREMAAFAKDEAARKIHLDLADKYRQLAEGSYFRPSAD